MTDHRSGFACFVGRPNAGKSTLTNAIVGEKVAITSSKPQTTRHTIRGIVHRPDAQLVLVDTPGLHKPRTLLGERLNAIVRETWGQVDVIGFCLPANEPVGPGDKFIATQLAAAGRTPKVAIVTKTDLVDHATVGQRLLDVARLGEATGIQWAEIVPVSAVAGDQVNLLEDLLVGLLPPGPLLYPDGELTDEPEFVMVAELIREAALEGVRDELPHSIAVVVDDMIPRENRSPDNPLIDVHASLYVERDSQKAIIIGHKGTRLRDVGISSRKQIEALLGSASDRSALRLGGSGAADSDEPDAFIDPGDFVAVGGEHGHGASALVCVAEQCLDHRGSRPTASMCRQCRDSNDLGRIADRLVPAGGDDTGSWILEHRDHRVAAADSITYERHQRGVGGVRVSLLDTPDTHGGARRCERNLRHRER